MGQQGQAQETGDYEKHRRTEKEEEQSVVYCSVPGAGCGGGEEGGCGVWKSKTTASFFQNRWHTLAFLGARTSTVCCFGYATAGRHELQAAAKRASAAQTAG